jgi:phosphoserine phosphatase RsbU/P
MEASALASVRDQLLDRRQKLEQATVTLSQSEDVVRLLQEVDAALTRVNAGRFGICETCHDPIEPERLVADPLIRFCIDHLSPREQRALEHDLELAAHIQREMLPKASMRVDGWAFAYHYQPAATVSGDYCDVIPGNSGDVYFIVGDVAGHGVAAAMLMSHLSALLRTLISLGLPLSDIMERANRAFCDSTLASHYATLVCGHACQSGEIEISNAGHPPPLLLHGDVVMRIDATGLPIGMFCSGRFPSYTIQLAPGDALLFYTDGLPEARNAAGEEYGIDRIADLVVSVSRAPSAMVDTYVRDVAAFRGAGTVEDDVTIFAVNRVWSA